MSNFRVAKLELDERTVVRRNPDIEHERAVAIFDLLEENYFRPANLAGGPFHLTLSIEDQRLVFDISDTADQALERVQLPLTAFRGIVRDYFIVCESYYQAIRRSSPSQIEALDMGRRATHNEGAELLRDRLADKIELDQNTARRLFTLICVLHIRG